MIKLLKFLKGNRLKAVAAPLFKLIEAICELIVPMLIASIIDVGIKNSDSDYVIKYCLIVIALAVAGLCFATTCQYLASKVALSFGTRIRSAMVKKINTLSLKEIDAIGGSSLTTRVSGDSVTCQNALGMFLRLVMRTPFIVIGSLVMAIMIDPMLSIVFLAMSIFVTLALYLIMHACLPKYRKAQKNLDAISSKTRESLKGARVMRAFNTKETEKRKFAAVCDDGAKISVSAGRLSAISAPVAFAVCNLAVIAILWFGGERVQVGTLSQGKIVALVNYLTQIFLAITAFANIILTFTRSAAASSRVIEVLDTNPSVTSGELTQLSDSDTAVKFNDVSFSYGGENDLSAINFSLKKGGSLGIIGGTGSGKSTLANLIMRFYDCNSGSVEFFGENVKTYNLETLRENIGYVPQKSSLLTGTLYENLQLADEHTTRENASSALQKAQAKELLDSMGLDGFITGGGKNLSGGQRQRVCVARALVKPHKLLLLDDASSALDFLTEKRLYDEVFTYDCAKIIVSQRVGSVMRCDDILVLDEGKAVGYGKHADLLKDCPLYNELYQSQTGASI